MKNKQNDQIYPNFREEFSTEFDAKLFAVPEHCLSGVRLEESKWQEIARACQAQPPGKEAIQKKKTNRIMRVAIPVAAVLVVGVGVLRLSGVYGNDGATQSDMMMLPAEESSDGDFSGAAEDAQFDAAPKAEQQQADNAAAEMGEMPTSGEANGESIESEFQAEQAKEAETGGLVVGDAGVEESEVLPGGSVIPFESEAADSASSETRAYKSMSYDPMGGILPDGFWWNDTRETDGYTVYAYSHYDGMLLEVTIWYDDALPERVAIDGKEVSRENSNLVYNEGEGGVYQAGWVDETTAAKLALSGVANEQQGEEVLEWAFALKARLAW